CMQSLQFPWTF
nr:immunoglobulin light chain junction region [Macaca mulatta]MOX52960.1 immunoglobulin light chain junction region [Macaca mulatta]MOX54932.1 immunoglobulin light chain junction region [Macaca mulatta]MOX57213.1 immunoglobulin light chain junction region [Macaca mulatta]MOX57408.1 immunoglobulin light chain junction region [Macaca mulatta]